MRSLALNLRENDCRPCHKRIRACLTKFISFQDGLAAMLKATVRYF